MRGQLSRAIDCLLVSALLSREANNISSQCYDPGSFPPIRHHRQTMHLLLTLTLYAAEHGNTKMLLAGLALVAHTLITLSPSADSNLVTLACSGPGQPNASRI